MDSCRWSVYRVKGGWSWKVIFRRRLYMGKGYGTKDEAWDELNYVLQILHETDGEMTI